MSSNSSASGSHGSGNTTAPHHGPSPAQIAMMAIFKYESASNAEEAKHYGISLASLVGAMILAHVARTFVQTHGRGGLLHRMVAMPFRMYRNVALRKLPKFTSVGHFLLIATYLGLNILFMFFKMRFYSPYNGAFFAKRSGWLAVVNLVLVFFLGMKNNPIAFLTGYSHERLNVLHRWVGRMIWVQSLLHVSLMSAAFVQAHKLEEFQEIEIIWGFVAFAAFTIIGISSISYIRRLFYEYFYLVHIAMFIVAVAALGEHYPELYEVTLIMAGSFWVFDRLLRIGRAVYHSVGNRATVYPLPDGTTKVVLSKSASFQPGSHGFLSIPQIRGLQSHPFTISSCTNVEFIVRAQRGFTKDLYNHAVANPGASMRCAFDGPYGAVPDYRKFNRVVLCAGGSGGSFTFPIAIDIARNIARTGVVTLEFVWVIRNKRNMEWFMSDLLELRSCPNVNLRIFVTKDTEALELIATHPQTSPNAKKDITTKQLDTTSPTALDKELGTSEPSSPSSSSSHLNELGALVEFGRPNLSNVITEVVKSADKQDLVGVAACGPTELMRVVRNAVATNITLAGPSVSLHCEQFGWA